MQVTTRFVAHLETNAVCDGVKGVFTSSLSILTDNLVGAAKTEFKDAVMLAVGQVVRSLVKCAVCAVRSRVGGDAAPAHDALATFHKNREMEAQVRRAGGEEQGTWASQKHSEAGDGRPVDRGVWAANTVKRPRQQPAHPPIRQLLGAADAQTAHPATSSTAPAHRPLGSANAETTPAGAPAAAADRKQRPDATCEGKNG